MDRFLLDLLFRRRLKAAAGPESSSGSEASSASASSPGSLTLVGLGIELGTQITVEARHSIERADVVLYLATNPLAGTWIRRLNPDAESLEHFYAEAKRRSVSYSEMVARILGLVREGKRVCVAAYGHPGVFAQPAHESIRQARQEGFQARMLPGVSAEDCLFADLGIDPGKSGCQSFEATHFLIARPAFDPRVPLVLWQVSVIGQLDHRQEPEYREGLAILTGTLNDHYPRDHEVVVYEAPQLPVAGPVIDRMPLHALPDARLPGLATLFVPPVGPMGIDREMAEALGLSPDKVGHD